MRTDRPLCAVVGFGPGIGAAVARRFAAGGFDVIGLARDPAQHASLSTDRIRLAMADAGEPESLAAIVPANTQVLVYNAYRMTLAASGPSTLTPAVLMKDFAVNVAGAMAATQAVLPGMRRAGRGTILFTGGGLALDPTGWLPAASLAVGKAGMRSLALSLHAELGPEGLHAATVTVAGTVVPGTAFDPDRIAEAYWALHQDPPGAFRAEIIFRG